MQKKKYTKKPDRLYSQNTYILNNFISQKIMCFIILPLYSNIVCCLFLVSFCHKKSPNLPHYTNK